jgi:hypothetical protein
MKHQIVAYGPRGLVGKAGTMFEPSDGGINLTGICPGGVCLTLPKDEVCFGTYRLKLRSLQTGEDLEVCGFGSRSFMPELFLFKEGKGSLTIAGKKMAHRPPRNKNRSEQYWLEVEFISHS